MSAFGPRRGRPEPVFLNVYDLNPQNGMLFPMGLGAFHSGVEVHGQEWTFASGGGVFSHTPKNAQGAPLRVSMRIGETAASSQEVATLVAGMRPDWPGSRYNVIKCNCNSFSDALLISLCGKRAPGWLNRLSYLGSLMPCLLPRGVADGPAPVDSEGGGAASSSSTTGFYTQPGRLSAATQRRSPTTTAAAATRGGGASTIGGTGHTLGGGRPAAATTAATPAPLGVRPDREAMAAAAMRRSEMQKAAAAAAATAPH